ncbi:MAG: D-alanyl-D-alanine carboxypeptidase family protein [Thermodesulfobacteriota bacterium]
MKTKRTSFPVAVCLSLFLMLLSPAAAVAKQAGKAPAKGPNTISKDPYIGAIVVDAADGAVLFEDNADAKGYPASITKLMDLLVILEAIKSNRLTLNDQVVVTAESARIGGSQVYLKEGEVFSIEELLYALIVQSANDAATAIALHYSGSKEAFVALMNKRAQELGMKDTVFHSVHGLPPGKGQSPDVSTPRDMVKLCRELLKHPETLRYTATTERSFRPNSPTPFIMRSHNHLLGKMEGCDGLKTGYYFTAGFSIAATASKNNQRAIAVVFGSRDRKKRDAKTRELLSKGLMELVMKAPPPTPPQEVQAQKSGQVAPEASAAAEENKGETEVIQIKKRTIYIAAGLVAGLFLIVVIWRSVRKREMDRGPYIR